MLGIGLGAFMGGFEKGYGLGTDIKDRKRTNKLQADEDATKERLKGIETDTQAQFDKGVAAGTEQPDKFDDFWLKYALPKRKMEMLKEGDVAGAKQLMDWGTSENTLKGGRLYASAMTKANLGDTDGAWDDAIAAAKTKGYVDHDYNILGRDTLQQDGKPIGSRLRVAGADGKEFHIDVPLGQDADAINSVLNPGAVAAQNATYAEEQRKRKEGIADYTTKKKVDQQYSDKKNPDAEAYGKVREDFMKNDMEFADLSDAEKDKKVRAALDQAEVYSQDKSGRAPGLGASSRPAPPQRIVVDKTTGKPVQAPAQPVGLGQPVPAPAQAAPPVAPQQGSPEEQPAQLELAPRADAAPTREAMIADAADYMKQGGNPNAIAQRLMSVGIMPQEWPQGLQEAVQSTQGNAAPSLPRSQ